MDPLKELRNLDKEEILAKLGLQSRRSAVEYALPVVGIFTAGILIGAGIGLLIAPKPGRKLRQELGRHVDEVRERITEAGERTISKAADQVSAN